MKTPNFLWYFILDHSEFEVKKRNLGFGKGSTSKNKGANLQQYISSKFSVDQCYIYRNTI
jgi:hypothetical protein